MLRIDPHVIQTAKPVVVLVGPTAVGKSQIGMLVAKAMGTDVLTADSRQVYRGMDVGTDKPSHAERQDVPHVLIDLVEPDEPFNAGIYRRLALKEIDRLHQAGKVPLVVGGTGLYVRTLLRGLWEGPPADWAYRRELEHEAEEKGAEWLYGRLSAVDPASARRVHPHDRIKIIRALEVHHLTGRPLSEEHGRHAFADMPFTPLLIGLNRERQSLYRRIDDRVELELQKGLVRETEALLKQGYGRQSGAMKSLGYKQIAGYVLSEYDYAEAVNRLKRDTRHFAKRQMTWFRKEPGLSWMMIEEHETAEQTADRIVGDVQRFVLSLASRAGQDATLSETAAG